MGCNWNLAKTRFEIVSEYFRSAAIGISLRRFEIVFGYFRWDAIGIWLRQDLELS